MPARAFNLSARAFTAIVAGVAAAVLATGNIARATMPAPKAGASAEPKSADQTGFPALLYQWSSPADNPQSAAKVALGKELFFDARISADGTVACANCHDPDKGFTDQLPTSMGVHGKFGQRNAPTVLNALFNIDAVLGRARANARGSGQAADPESDRDGQNPDRAAVVEQAQVDRPSTRKVSRRSSARRRTTTNMARAIAAYERTQIAFDSPFDHFAAATQGALTAQQQRGWAIFNGQGRCMSCHG